MAEDTTKYQGICPVCGAVMWITPNLFMVNGWSDIGHGKCWNCGELLSLKFDREKKEFRAKKWDEYMNQFRKDRETMMEKGKNEQE